MHRCSSTKNNRKYVVGKKRKKNKKYDNNKDYTTVNQNDEIVRVTLCDRTVYIACSCVYGKLIEINEYLPKNQSLLETDHFLNG